MSYDDVRSSRVGFESIGPNDCDDCLEPPLAGDPLVRVRVGGHSGKIHRSHVTDPSSRYSGAEIVAN